MRVDNPTGNVTVHTVMGGNKAVVNATTPTRARRPDDVMVTRGPGELTVECRPEDGARVDVDITLPHSSTIQVSTKRGAISLTGILRGADLITQGGAVKLALPWAYMSLRAVSPAKPTTLIFPKRIERGRLPTNFVSKVIDGSWFFGDAPRPSGPQAAPRARGKEILVGRDVSYAEYGGELGSVVPQFEHFGVIRVKFESPRALELTEIPLPADSWVWWPMMELHRIEAFLDSPHRRPKTEPEKGGVSGEGLRSIGSPVFVSKVRMMSLSAPVYDREGRPATGLRPEDFEILEDGVPQKIAGVSQESPFTLALLLDLSGSAISSRETIMAAARKFVGIARPQDRVAIYAMAESLFEVICPLTTDRKRLLEAIDSIQPRGGGSPLYKSIALSYMQESLDSAPDPTALVILSDGVDASLWHPPGKPADQRTKEFYLRLRKAVQEMRLLLYPLLFPPREAESYFSEDARPQMQALADVSGGRLFRVDSLGSIDPVYGQVAEELRSIYTVSYYPKNQEFDGKWRKVTLRVKPFGATPRTRKGYYAW